MSVPPCDFDVTAAIVDLDGTTVLLDMNDHEAGYTTVSVAPLAETRRREVVTSPYVHGRFETSAVDDGGTYGVIVRVKGSTWAQMYTRRLALRDAYRSAPKYFLDISIKGVTERWRCTGWPEVTTPTLDANNLILNELVLSLEFPVQPNPTVTGA